MSKVAIDTQHIHADVSMTESQVLELATKQAQSVVPGNRLLIDVKKIAQHCQCEVMPEGSAWMVILYYLE